MRISKLRLISSSRSFNWCSWCRWWVIPIQIGKMQKNFHDQESFNYRIRFLIFFAASHQKFYVSGSYRGKSMSDVQIVGFAGHYFDCLQFLRAQFYLFWWCSQLSCRREVMDDSACWTMSRWEAVCIIRGSKNLSEENEAISIFSPQLQQVKHSRENQVKSVEVKNTRRDQSYLIKI